MTTILKFAGFIILNLLILFGAHYFLYFSIIKFFGIVEPIVQKIIMWIIIILALSFIPSALLLRLHVNILTCMLYRAASIWLGLFIMLLMALIIIWMIYWIGKFLGHYPDMSQISLFFFFLSAMIMIFGMWKAFNPEIREIDIKISGLPEQWKNRKIIQLSGHTHGGQFYPFVWIARRIYKEYYRGLHRDGDFQIYVSSGVGTWGPPIRIGAPGEIVLIRLK